MNVNLVFTDANLDNPDPATRSAVARRAVEMLRSDNYEIHPAKTELMGGDFYELVMQIGQFFGQHEQFFTALITAAAPIVTFFFSVRWLHISNKSQSLPASSESKISIVFEIDGKSIKISAPDAGTVAITAAELERQFRIQHPEVVNNVTSQSHVSITHLVSPAPAKTRRRT